MNTNSTKDSSNYDQNASIFYLAAWRWHFYAGIFVIPVLLMLSITGLLMLHSDSINEYQQADILFVDVEQNLAPVQKLQQTVEQQYPGAIITEYIPQFTENNSAQFSVTNQDNEQLLVYVNPYTAEVLGDDNKADQLYNIANDIHGSFLLGDSGDRIIEIAAGLGIMLVITGLYLWWPRSNQVKKTVFWPRFSSDRRTFWRDLHACIGFYISLFLIFFLITGMSWTGVWGSKFVQAWNSFPAEKWADVPLSSKLHAEMNHGVAEEVPWNLEQTPMPASGSMVGADGIPSGTAINLDSISAYALNIGFERFRINLPQGTEGVYTVSADTMSGDITDPRNDRTVHIDQYTGKKLVDIGWADYTLMAKSMAAGVGLHQGDLGWWNLLLNTLFCLAIIALSLSAIIMWWLRRPVGTWRLAAPPLPANMPLWKGAVLIMLLVSLAFPLVGLTLLVLLSLDLLLFSRIPALQRLLN